MKFGSGLVELGVPERRLVVVLDPRDVGRVLDGSPAPFHPANREKQKALRWFQPHGVLITRGSIREQRRAVNEAALQTNSELHRLADSFAAVIAQEADRIVDGAVERGHLDSAQFMTEWWRLVRRVALGDRAADDETITDQLMRLRKAGNWSFLAVPRRRLREQFTERHLQLCRSSATGNAVACSGRDPGQRGRRPDRPSAAMALRVRRYRDGTDPDAGPAEHSPAAVHLCARGHRRS